MNRRIFMKTVSTGAIALSLQNTACSLFKRSNERPNILWIIAEDMSPHFGYNGEKAVDTPNVDKLADEGTVFSNMYVTCPVCSPCRSALITGMYQTTIGAHNHRSSSTPESAIHLPENIKTIPDLFKENGYFTCNIAKDLKWYKPGKTDYNFVYNFDKLYDSTDWKDRKPGQPFFAQIQLQGGKARNAKFDKMVDPNKIKLPPYYPNDPVILDDWSKYLNTVMKTDKEVGIIIERLKKEKALENTIIFFITDHGISHARGKQFLYDEGTKVPFIVWGPKWVKSGVVRDELTVHIDMAATSLYFAGVEIPEYMESRPLFGKNAKPREYVVSARDRCDETEDRIRSVRKGNYKYIRNFHPNRPYLQPCVYKDYKGIIKRLRELYSQGELNEYQSLIMAENRPKEELYDLSKDPFELTNLAGNPVHKKKLVELRSILEKWINKTDDKGQYPESWDDYLANMKAQNANLLSRNKTEKVERRNKNILLMKEWREKGI